MQIQKDQDFWKVILLNRNLRDCPEFLNVKDVVVEVENSGDVILKT